MYYFMNFASHTAFSIRNARVVTADQVLTGGIAVSHGRIDDVNSGAATLTVLTGMAIICYRVWWNYIPII
jgi:hypothetical protein